MYYPPHVGLVNTHTKRYRGHNALNPVLLRYFTLLYYVTLLRYFVTLRYCKVMHESNSTQIMSVYVEMRPLVCN